MMRLGRKHIKVGLVVLALALFAVGQAWGATKYVSPTGSDAADGSIATPWRTIEYALENGGMAWGDTLKLVAGTHNRWKSGSDGRILSSFGAGTGGPVIIEPVNTTDNVIIDIPTLEADDTPQAIATGYLYSGDAGGVTTRCINLRRINFTNSASAAGAFIIISPNRNFKIEDCTFDHNNVATVNMLHINAANSASCSILVYRSKFYNAQASAFKNDDSDTSGANFFLFESCLFYNLGQAINMAYPGGLATKNCTFAKSTGVGSIVLTRAGNIFSLKNSIFVQQTTGISLYVSDAAAVDLFSNPSNFDVTNNVFWNVTTPLTSAIYEATWKGANELMPAGTSNFFINPILTDFTNNNYIPTGLNICGRGAAASLPSGGDITGAAWAGNDIGCYKNASASVTTITPNASKFGFVGDSIMNGSSATDGNKCYEKLAAMTGLTNVIGGGVSGLGVEGFRFSVDQFLIDNSPAVVFVSIGVNNLVNAASNDPANLTNAQLATEIITCLQKIADWGVRPVWLGIPSLVNNQTEPEAVNALVEAACVTNGWSYGSILARMKFRSDWNSAGVYYDNLAADVHPNNTGHLLIASLAENLYYNRYPYWVAAANVGGLQAGTYQHPLTAAQITSSTVLRLPATMSIAAGDYSGQTMDLSNASNSGQLTLVTNGKLPAKIVGNSSVPIVINGAQITGTVELGNNVNITGFRNTP